MTLIPNDYQKEMNETFEIFRKEIDALKAENKELKEQLHLHDVVGQSEQLVCNNHFADLEHFMKYSESICKTCKQKV